ncbi:YwmB family TATA-box binding protein [Paenibacillus lentus]|uniref:YwmB family TATA-box binding protein n=1 Tax=Paenibacillus lentus TaxID=1338368 RepID=UPI0036477D30
MMKKLWGIMVMIIVAGAVVVKSLNGIGITANADAAYSSEAESSRVQLEKMLAVGENLTQGDMQGTVKWQGEWQTGLSLEAAAEVLADRLGLANRYAEQVHERDVFYAEGTAGDIHGKLAITSQAEGLYYVVLRLENQSMAGLDQLAEYGAGYGEALLKEGVRVKWNAALQGAALAVDHAAAFSDSALGGEGYYEGGIQDFPANAAFEAMESRAREWLELRQVEGFEDDRTISRSYAVEEFPIKVKSAGKNIGLQLAVHWNTETNRYDVSLGSPLLTVEY